VNDTPDWGHATELADVSGAVAIVGIGETAYTKASGRTAREIGAEAAERAIADCGLEPEAIDGLTYNAAFADFDVTTSLGTRITFKNPPDGNNINPSVVAIQITGRGSYVAV